MIFDGTNISQSIRTLMSKHTVFIENIIDLNGKSCNMKEHLEPKPSEQAVDFPLVVPQFPVTNNSSAP